MLLLIVDSRAISRVVAFVDKQVFQQGTFWHDILVVRLLLMMVVEWSVLGAQKLVQSMVVVLMHGKQGEYANYVAILDGMM